MNENEGKSANLYQQVLVGAETHAPYKECCVIFGCVGSVTVVVV